LTAPPFDFDQVFGDDYMHFYEQILDDEVSDRQTALITKLLDVKPGMRILDCPCGHGRIANRLARVGADVVGVDRSEAFLRRAREAGTRADYRLGDMRALDFDGEFDAVVNIFTSFGYFDEETDKAVLRRFRRALKPRGRLLLELQNGYRMMSILAAGGGRSDHLEQRGDDLLIDRSTYDALTGRTLTERTSVRAGKVRRYRFSVRLFTLTELAAWLRDTGFSQIAAFDQDGETYALTSRRMCVVAS
jgi:SAM-dependent methyltransferase